MIPKPLFDIVAEMDRAGRLHKPLPVRDPVRCAAILAEECGEVAAEALALTRPAGAVVSHRRALRAEVLHVAAVCVLWLEEGWQGAE